MKTTRSIRFIYVWRLDYEKGVDVILETFSTLFELWRKNITLEIFGRGSMVDEVGRFADQYDQAVYHGFESKEVVLETRKQCEYCLVPSRFLETFGLSALDSLGIGIPVIAPSKGWLASFVLPELTLGSVDQTELTRVVDHAVQIVSQQEKYNWLVEKSLERYRMYSREARYTRVVQLWLPQELLILTDYGANHGGIETLIQEMSDQLFAHGHSVDTLVATEQQLSRGQRYLWLVKTLFNYMASRSVRSSSTPLMRWHSVHRQLGRLPLSLASSTPQHWIMIHDMGMLHPFPAAVEQEQQIQKAATFAGWVQEWVSVKWWAWLPLIVAKWISVKMIRMQVQSKKMLVQVPAPYLVAHVSRWVWGWCEVVCLPHFVLQPEKDG